MKISITILIVLMAFAFTVNAQGQAKKKGDVYYEAEVMPEYPGGLDALRKHIAAEVKYPEKAKKEGISGKVYVNFVVGKDGKVVDALIARGVNPELDKEALRVVNKMETWKPGKEDGKTVKVAYTIPINFALDSKSSSKLEGDVYAIVDEMPVFPGGDNALREFISKSVKYPDQAKKEGIKGKVYVSFVINEEGEVTRAKIERGVCPSLDKESLRVVGSIPDWKPGKEDGKPVKVQYTVPINFALK